MSFEWVALALGLVLVYLLFRITKSLIHLVISSVIAIILLFGLNALGLGVAINIWSVLVVVFGGLPGFLLVVALHMLGIAF